MKQFLEINAPAWTPFVRSSLSLDTSRHAAQAWARAHGIPYAAAKQALVKLAADEVWVNSRYQVNIDRDPPHGFGSEFAVVHLSIKRHDKLPLHDWRDLQRIKNELCGPDQEALELYPKESRVVDTANQYHLWVMPEGFTVPVGWGERKVEKEHAAGGHGRVGQRAIED